LVKMAGGFGLTFSGQNRRRKNKRGGEGETKRAFHKIKRTKILSMEGKMSEPLREELYNITIVN